MRKTIRPGHYVHLRQDDGSFSAETYRVTRTIVYVQMLTHEAAFNQSDVRGEVTHKQIGATHDCGAL